MKKIEIELPDSLAREVEQAVFAGLYPTQEAAIQAAVREQMSRSHLEILAGQQREDVAWVRQLHERRAQTAGR